MENSSSTKGVIELRLSIIDLPTPIMTDILLQIPVEKIVICKWVCKAWYKLISDPQFVKLYSVYPLVRPFSVSHVSRTLYYVDPKYCAYNNSSKMSLQTKLKIPVHNSKILFESEIQAKLTQKDCGTKRKRYLELKPDDHWFNIMSSCKGLLCLSNNDDVVICNPVTGEYVNFAAPKVELLTSLWHWLGFSPKSNNYKVIRMSGHSSSKWCTNRDLRLHYSQKHYYDPGSSYAQIQILGSKSWKDIGLAPRPFHLQFPTFLNATLNWVYYHMSPKFIVSFDFDNHLFGSFSLPPCASNYKACRRMRIGVLRDKLCYCSPTNDGSLHIWVMSEYGVEETWAMVSNVLLSGEEAIKYFGFYQPINQLENGAIILFYKKDSKKCGFIYYEPETHILKSFRIGGVSASFEVIAFSPSFISLKDVLVGDEVEVLNVKSRCAELKIPKENRTPFLVQNNIARMPDLDGSKSLDVAIQD